MKKISGKNNDRIRHAVMVGKHPGKDGLVLIEGVRVVDDAFTSGVNFRCLFITEERLKGISRALLNAAQEVFIINDDVACKISQTINPQGVFALIELPGTESDAPELPDQCKRIMICDGVSDPGNMGNIIRSADAFGFDCVAVSPDSVSPYNDKAIRGSAGSVFHIKVFRISSVSGFTEELKRRGFTIYTTSLKGKPFGKGYSFDLPCAVIVGNEGKGVSEKALDLADHILRIPMSGKAESLNVASAASILAYLCGDQDEMAINQGGNDNQ